MLDTTIVITLIFFGVGTLDFIAYCLTMYKIRFKEQNDDMDIKSLWKVFYSEKNSKLEPIYSIIFLFFLGFFSSILSIILHYSVIVIFEKATYGVCAFYLLFFLSLLPFPLLSPYGDTYYPYVVMFIMFTSMFSGGLFFCDVYIWGVQDWKAWILFPLFLHCTLNHLFWWACLWNPEEKSRFTKVLNENTENQEDLISEDMQSNSKSKKGVFTVEDDEQSV
jgi:hypothetical protein